MAKDEADEKDEGGKGGGGALKLVLVAVVCVGIGAGGAFAVLRFSGGAQPEAAPEVAEAETESVEPSSIDLAERLVTLDPFVVNVTGDGYPRYLKLKIGLEADSVSTREEVETRVPQIRDAIIVLLSSKRLADVTDFEGKALLKDDILERVNDLLETGRVRSALFTEFVVQ